MKYQIEVAGNIYFPMAEVDGKWEYFKVKDLPNYFLSLKEAEEYIDLIELAKVNNLKGPHTIPYVPKGRTW